MRRHVRSTRGWVRCGQRTNAQIVVEARSRPLVAGISSSLQSFWKLSQAYAYAELLRRNEEKNKLKLASCAKDALRVVSIGLVVLGLMTSFFISFVCYNDDLNVFNISMVCISG